MYIKQYSVMEYILTTKEEVCSTITKSTLFNSSTISITCPKTPAQMQECHKTVQS